jgi:hypothetical protein
MRVIFLTAFISFLLFVVTYLLFNSLQASLLFFIVSLVVCYPAFQFYSTFENLLKNKKILRENYRLYGEIMIIAVMLGFLGNLTASFFLEAVKDIFDNIKGFWALLTLVTFFITVDIGLWVFLQLAKKPKKRRQGVRRTRARRR